MRTDDKQYQFQSTHPVRGGTLPAFLWFLRTVDFNPPTPCGVGPKSLSSVRSHKYISIHPPRAGWDDIVRLVAGFYHSISIHPPRAGWDQVWVGNDVIQLGFQSTHPVRGGTDGLNELRSKKPKFQSTHPVRGGTRHRNTSKTNQHNFNPPTPCGVGLYFFSSACEEISISIHPPRAGWD